MTVIDLTTPIPEETIRALHAGDEVRLSGVIVTGRDAAHEYMIDTLIRPRAVPESEHHLRDELRRLLKNGVIYHCGPVVRDLDGGGWEFVAAGPTTSIREEMYQPEVIAHFGLRGVIGKGGMGADTLRACETYGAVYFHGVGGAASLIAEAVKEVLTVFKRDEFGTPEAFWVIRVEQFPVVVTMDSHGRSLHDEVETASRRALNSLVGFESSP